MKNLLVLITLFYGSTMIAQSKVKEEFANDPIFKGIVADELFKVAVIETAKETNMSIKYRPYFDKYIVSLKRYREEYTENLVEIILNNEDYLNELSANKTLTNRVRYIVNNLNAWKEAADIYLRENIGEYKGPYTTNEIKTRIVALEKK